MRNPATAQRSLRTPIVPPIDTTKVAERPEPLIERERDLVRCLLRLLDTMEPRLPVTDKGRAKLDAFIQTYLLSTADPAANDDIVEDRFIDDRIMPSEVVAMIDVSRSDDGAAARCGHRLLLFVASVAEGLLGEYSPDLSDHETFQPIPPARVIDMMLSIDDKSHPLLRVRRKGKIRVVTMTREGERALGARVRVELARLRHPPLDPFDLVEPYC